MAYSHHREASFGKKKSSQERLASRISTLLDRTLNDDDDLPNLVCAKCKRRVESLEICTWIILRSLQVRTLTSHDMRESENSPEFPHLGEIKRMRKQCIPGASPFFTCARDEATFDPAT